MGEFIVKKHTIVPLYGFTGPFFQDVDLGNSCFIAKLPKGIFDNFLEYGRLWDPGGKTKVLDIFEKDRFLTTFCIDHRYEGPESPHQSSSEEESKKNVKQIVQAIQLIKFTMTASEFIIQTQGDDYKVVDALKTHERSLVPESSLLTPQPFTIQDIEKVKILWPRIRKIYIEHKEKFNRIANALEFFRVSLGIPTPQLKFILFVVALESVYSISNVEIAYSLSQRLAWFLGSNSEERVDYFNKARKIYYIRSQIVHGTIVRESLWPEIDDLLAGLEDITRQTLAKILLEDDLRDIFSNTEKLKDYFDSLTLNHTE